MLGIGLYILGEKMNDVTITKEQAVHVFSALSYFIDYVWYGPEETSDSLNHHIEKAHELLPILRDKLDKS